MRLSVLVPAYREERTIGELLRRVVALDLSSLAVEVEVIVCDDGSDDNTAAEVRRVQCCNDSIRLVSHPRNRGKGLAIRTALSVAAGDYVLIQDADLEYEVEDYCVLVAAVQSGAEVVYGSRFRRRAFPRGMCLVSFLANRLLTATANFLFGLHLTDEATCLKLFKTDLLRSLQLTSERFEFCSEVTAKLGLIGVPIVEVPVRYQARSIREGKKVRWTDGVEAFRTLLQVHALRKFPTKPTREMLGVGIGANPAATRALGTVVLASRSVDADSDSAGQVLLKP